MAYNDYKKQVRINEDQLEELKKLAAAQDMTAARLLNKILAKNLKKNK